MDTKFRNVLNSQQNRQAARAASAISNTGFMGQGKSDSLKLQDTNEVSDNQHLKSTFKPIDLSPGDSTKDRISNLNPVKISDTIHEVNLRSIVVMDNEP